MKSITTLLDRATAASRRRHGEAPFWGVTPSLRDSLLTRLYFGWSVREWSRRAADPQHVAPFVAGLERCRRPRVVLDLGTGPGATAAEIATRYPDAWVYGVDGSRRMVRAAAALHRSRNLSFVRADVRLLPFDDRRFDLVCMLNANPDLDELARIATADAEVLMANTYFELPGPDWLERWRLAGWTLVDAENTGAGHWQLFRRSNDQRP